MKYILAGVVAGWGTLSEGGAQATILQEVEVTVVSDQNCSLALTQALGQHWG